MSDIFKNNLNSAQTSPDSKRFKELSEQEILGNKSDNWSYCEVSLVFGKMNGNPAIQIVLVVFRILCLTKFDELVS